MSRVGRNIILLVLFDGFLILMILTRQNIFNSFASGQSIINFEKGFTKANASDTSNREYKLNTRIDSATVTKVDILSGW